MAFGTAVRPEQRPMTEGQSRALYRGRQADLVGTRDRGKHAVTLETNRLTEALTVWTPLKRASIRG